MAAAVATPEEIEEKMDIANSLAFLMPNFYLRGLDGWGTGRSNNINDNNNIKTDMVTYQEIHVATHQGVDMEAVQSFLLLVSKLYKYGVDGVCTDPRGNDMPDIVDRIVNNKIDNNRVDDYDNRQPINQPTAHRKLPKLRFFMCNQCVYATKKRAHINSHKLSHTGKKLA